MLGIRQKALVREWGTLYSRQMRKNHWITFIAGLAAGTVFAIACNQVSNANASTTDCTTWQFSSTSVLRTSAVTDENGDYLGKELPPGWEPVGITSSGETMA